MLAVLTLIFVFQAQLARYRLAHRIVRNGFLLFTLVFIVMQLLVKRAWLAAMIAGAVFGFLVTGELGTEQLVASIGLSLTLAAVYTVTLLYRGVLAQAIAFLVNFVLGQGTLTADFSKLYASTSVSLLLLVAGAAALGFYLSRGSEPLFGRPFEAT